MVVTVERFQVQMRIRGKKYKKLHTNKSRGIFDRIKIGRSRSLS